MTGLAEHHQALLDASTITPEVAAARGYFTATTGAELGRLGFAPVQRIAPALVLPLWTVTGEIGNYQARPDRPRVDAERGREIKYETVAGSHVRLDVLPPVRKYLGSARSPLFVTEGIRKGDALASRDLCAIALLGVDCFQTDDWDRVALDERRVYICFDSDVMRKASVHDALERLAKLLAAKGAVVSFVYLPEDDGKVGVDDYLARGHTVDELYRLAEPELRELSLEGTPHRPAAWPVMWALDAIEKLLKRFVLFPSEHEPVALALYVAHTYALDAAQATPYMLIVSPEKRAGKTRALETLELMVREDVRAGNITAAGVFQAIEAWTPTLLVDEVDAIFRARSEQAETLRAVLNAGNRRGSYVVRGSQDGKPVKFSTWSAKVLAGINNQRLPDTVRDRSIVIGMQRLNSGEHVQDLFPAEIAETIETLTDRLADWADENIEWLTTWRRSERIRQLDTRLQEAWDPLLAIAELAGGDWPDRARAAAIALAESAVDPSEAEHGHILLTALRSIFADNGDVLASKVICEKLDEEEELPFGGYGDGSGIKPRTLAKLLKPYGIKSKTVWIKDKSAKGYHRDDFDDAWKRYTPEKDTPATGPSKETSEASGPSDASSHGNGNLTDLTDLTFENGPSATRVSSNGRVVEDPPVERREPFCRRDDHRRCDWALPEAEAWTCGLCHPPHPDLEARAVFRDLGAAIVEGAER